MINESVLKNLIATCTEYDVTLKQVDACIFALGRDYIADLIGDSVHPTQTITAILKLAVDLERNAK